MKVILLQDIARIGRRFEVRNVPDGHALNFLIPRNMAKLATPQNLKQLEHRQSKEAASVAEDDAQFNAAREKLAGKTVEMVVEANEKGHLFKGIHAEDIAVHLNAAESLTLNASQIVLPAPLKTTGEHTIEFVNGDQTGSVTLLLVSNKAS